MLSAYKEIEQFHNFASRLAAMEGHKIRIRSFVYTNGSRIWMAFSRNREIVITERFGKETNENQ